MSVPKALFGSNLSSKGRFLINFVRARRYVEHEVIERGKTSIKYIDLDVTQR